MVYGCMVSRILLLLPKRSSKYNITEHARSLGNAEVECAAGLSPRSRFKPLPGSGNMKNSSWRMLLVTWDVLVTCSIIVSTFLVTYQAIFNAAVVWHWAVVYAGDVIFITSVGLNFLRSYTNHRGEVITDKKLIMFRYLCTSLFYDLLSIIPFEMVAIIGEFNDLNYMVAILRLNRSLRLYQVWTFLYMKEKQLGTNTMLLMSLRFIFIGAVSVHFIAGLWFATACTNMALVKKGEDVCSSGSWARHQNLDWKVASDYEKYVVSLYWAVTTVTSVGYGDITPKTSTEKWVALICMLWGVTLFGCILGELASLLTNADAQRTCYIHRLNVIKEELTDAQVSPGLMKRTIGFYEYLWKRNKGKSVLELFNQLPLALQAEISLDSYKRLLERSSLFKGSPEEFLRMLSLNVKPILYLPHQVIVNKGVIDSHMYIVQMGEAEVLEDERSPPVVLKQGDIFGESNMVCTAASTKVLRARTHCNLLMISKGDMLNILQHFPKVEAHLKKGARRCHDFSASDTYDDEQEAVNIPLLTQEQTHKHRTKKRPRFVACITRPFMPGSKFIIVWDLLVVAVTILICWIYSYQAAFTHFNPKLGYTGSEVGKLLLAVTYIFDCILIIDILISMKRAISTHTGTLTKPRGIVMHYVFSLRFVLDTLAVLPLELLAIIWMETQEEWKYIPVFRLNRLLKFWKVIAFFTSIEEFLHISIAYVTLLKYAVYILTVKHISACLWFFIACYNENSCLSNSWANIHEVAKHTSAWQDYVISLYWSTATMTTVGYGDISAYNTQEMVMSMIVQLVGVMLYGYCLGVVAAILTNSIIPRVSFQEKMEAIHKFMKDHKMGKGLLRRVDRYFTLLWKQYNGESFPGGENLIQDMPRSAQEDICMKRCGSLLTKVPFFADTSTAFLRQLSVSTSVYLFSPGDIILYGGDMGRDMYCIRKGFTEVLSEDLFHVVTLLGPGSYFGEIGFLYGTPCLYTVRAATYCQLVMVKWPDVENLLTQFPDVKRKFDSLVSNNEALKAAQRAVLTCSTAAMRRPKKFSKPSVTTALTVTLATPLSIIIRQSMSNTVVACVGGLEMQSKITAPISIRRSDTIGGKSDTIGGSGMHTNYKPELVVKYSRCELRELGTSRTTEKIEGKMVYTRKRKELVKEHKEQATMPEGDDDANDDGGHVMQDEKTDFRSSDSSNSAKGSLWKIFSWCVIPYSILPNTKFYYFWNALSVFLVLLLTITISLQTAFLHRDGVLWGINYFLDLFFIVDMVLNMHMGYYNKRGVLVTHLAACIAHYLRTKFVIDLISSFPTDFLVLAAWTKNVHNVLRLLSLVRINRLLKLYKLPLAFKALEEKITISIGPVKVFEFFIYVSLGTHLTACVWFMLACSSLNVGPYNPHTCNVESLAHHHSKTLPYYSILHQYIVSLYWATATTTTVGYGDIRAQDRIYAIIIMVFGVVAYGYLIASVAASLVNADAGRAQYQSKLIAIKSYLKDYKVNKALRKRVIRYYEYLWQRNKGVNFEDLFQGMPLSLQADTSISLYKPIIDRVSLFTNTELGFTKLLALSIKPLMFLSGEYVVRKGDIGTEMYFIYRGSVEIVSEDGKVVFAVMKEGQFFGEISLFFSCPRTASIRAATNSDLFVVKSTDLYHALSCYPHIQKQIRRIAGKRADLARKRSMIVASALAKGMSPSNAAKVAATQTQTEVEESEGMIYRPQPPKSQKTSQGIKKRRKAKGCCWACFKRLFLFTIRHDGSLGFCIYWIGCLFSYYSFFTISYQAAFQDNTLALWIINYLFEAYFLIELFLKFHLTYEDHRGNRIRDIKTIFYHNFRTFDGFLMDCITLFPYELLVLPIPDAKLRNAAVLYMRLPHLARVIRVKWMFDVQQKYLNQHTVILQMFKSIVLVTLSTHSVACAWYFLACRAGTCQKNTWASAASLLEENTPHTVRYGNSYYWTVTTMTTVGYGDLSATNMVEMVYAIAVMLLGKILFGFILGTVASTLANLEIGRVVYEDKLKALKEYLKQQHVSSTLRHRVFRFFEYSWLRNKGTNRQDILSDMPYCMRAEVSLAITESMLRKVSIFEDADSAFLCCLAIALKPCLFLPGDFIVHKGDLGYGMFFLHHGQVELIDGDESKSKKQLRKGDSFGLRSLLFSMPVDFSARAVIHTDVFVFSSADFVAALKDHPQAEARIQSIVVKEYDLPLQL